jgi:hypothetical protein
MQSCIENTGSIIRNITSYDGTEVIEILDSRALYTPYDGLGTAWYVGKKLMIEELQITVNLASFPLAQVPDIAPEDTAAEKLLKISQSERAYPSLGFALYRKIGNQWRRQALPKFQNYGSERYLPLLQPYLGITEVKVMGDNEKLGVQVVDLGGGSLKEGDYITVTGSWSQTISLVRKETGVLAATIPFSCNLTRGVMSQVVPARPGRRTLTLQNHGRAVVWFLPTNEPSALQVGASLYLEPGGSSYTSFGEWILDKQVYAIAEGDTKIVG